MTLFQRSMEAVVARTQAIDIRAYEIATADQLVQDLAPQVLNILSEGRSVLTSVLDTCGEADEIDVPSHGGLSLRTSFLPFDEAIDSTVATRLGSYRIIEEIAFLAQMELSQRYERVSRTRPAHGALTVLGECDSSLRRVRKALSAVDRAIANAEAVSPVLDFTSELETSLAIRKAYAKFRMRVLEGGDPAPATLRSRFRAAGTAIAVLVGWRIYPEMRVRDRILLRELQQRILTWLRSNEPGDHATGLRLWQDLAAFIHMLSLVNRRQELMAHDVRTLREAQRRLGELDAATVVGDDTWAMLQDLEGLNDDLDVLLDRNCRPLVGDCVRLLRSMTASLASYPGEER